MFHRINGLTRGAGGDTLAEDHKPFQFMFTWHTQRQPFEEVAISREPGAVRPFCRDRKMLAWNNLCNSLHRLASIHLDIVIHEQAVVY